jgi:hypothetical protein
MTRTSETTGVFDAFKQQATDSTVALGVSAVYTGPWIDLGPGGGKISATARSDQSGTLTVQESADAVTAGQVVASEATAAVGGLQIATASAVTTKEFVRVVFTNGTTAQTSFELDHFASC